MAEKTGDNSLGHIIGGFAGSSIPAGLWALAPQMAPQIGWPLTVLVVATGIVAGVVFFVVFTRYVEVLGAGAMPEATSERIAYDALRDELGSGGTPVRLYTRWLTSFLQAVDRFFGDAQMADRTLFPRAFGLKASAPLWTAAGFDRCLLLAFFYPVVMIFLTWVISADAGPASAALSFQDGQPNWARGLSVLGAVLAILGIWGHFRSTGWRAALCLLLGLTGGVMLVLGGALGIGVAACFVVLSVAFLSLVRRLLKKVRPTRTLSLAPVHWGVATIFAVLIGIIAFPLAIFAAAVFFQHEDPFVLMSQWVAVSLTLMFFACTGLTTIALASGLAASRLYERTPPRLELVFLALFVLAMIVACLVAADTTARRPDWEITGPLLLFVVFLALINAPFNWISLGVTRALLRRGIELQGWWPYALAFVDALVAVAVIALLTCAMVIGIQAFNLFSTFPPPGGYAFLAPDPVLSLNVLFDGIAGEPAATKYWWVYAILLAAVIPSLINLTIGGAALTRGVPGVSAALLRRIPEGQAVVAFDRNWIALVLTAQWFLGTALGIGAQIFLVWIVFAKTMPMLGVEFLDMARWTASLDVPARLYHLFS